MMLSLRRNQRRAHVDVGAQMMQSANLTAFIAVVGADRIMTANREVFDGCSKSAARKRESGRCTIRVAPAL